MKKQPASSILGLALSSHRLEGVVLRRSNGSLKQLQSFAATLALNPLTDDPALVGREIRNHLEQAGIRERRCVIAIPMNWIATREVQVPDLPEEDAQSFLQIEAERGFHYGHELLSILSSRYAVPTGQNHAMLVAVPHNHLAQLEKVLRAAKLLPLSFTLGIAAMQPAIAEGASGVLALALAPGDAQVELQITCGGGVAALRALDVALDSESASKHIHGDLMAREIRITLGQMPAPLRDTVRTVRIFGGSELAGQLAAELTPRLRAMGLVCEHAASASDTKALGSFSMQAPVSAASIVAVQYLRGATPAFEFLPPRVSSFRQLKAKVSSKKVFWASAAAGAAVLLTAGAFLTQQWRLSSRQSRWTEIESRVAELDALQQKIRKFRPWFDESFGNLKALRKITESFPEDGTVTAKTLEIRNLSTVSCTGTARDKQALLGVLDQLGAAREVQILGDSPLQFTLNLHLKTGGDREN